MAGRAGGDLLVVCAHSSEVEELEIRASKHSGQKKQRTHVDGHTLMRLTAVHAFVAVVFDLERAWHSRITCRGWGVCALEHARDEGMLAQNDFRMICRDL